MVKIESAIYSLLAETDPLQKDDLLCLERRSSFLELYRGVSSHFFGIGILPVSDVLGIGIFGWYSRC